MNRREDPTKWTFDQIRDYLLNGRSPRLVGGEDAAAKKRPPGGIYMTPFIRDVYSKAQELCHWGLESTENGFISIAAALRSSPYTVASPAHRAQAVVASLESTIDEKLVQETSALMQMCDAEKTAGKLYLHDIQVAGASHPRGGWNDAASYWTAILVAVAVEASFGAFMLTDAIGWAEAAFTGSMLALTSTGGGVLSALSILRPTKQVDVARWFRALQWGLAVASGAGTGLLLYVGACYRATLIGGQDATPSEILQKFLTPSDVLLDFHVAVLGVIGIAGFCFGAREAYAFYNGYRSPLRRSGLAHDSAQQTLKDKANELKAFVAHRANLANAELTDIENNVHEWLATEANNRDELDADVLTITRWTDLVRRAFESILAEYVDGYLDVAPKTLIDELTYPELSAAIEAPANLSQRGTGLASAAALAAQAIAAARASVAEIARRAVERIDELAGFSTPATGPSKLPPTLPGMPLAAE